MSLLHPEQGKEGKTERGSEKKRREARDDGKVVFSMEINTVVVLAASFLTFLFMLPYIHRSLGDFLQYWSRLDQRSEWSPKFIQSIMGEFMKTWLVGFGVVGGVALLTAIATSIAQTKPFFSTKVLKLRFDSLNPVNGVKQLFSKDSLVKLAISIMKVSLVTLIVWTTIRKEIPQLTSLYRLDLHDGISWFMALLTKVVWKILVLYIIIAIIDWIKEKRKFELNIMMTKQEVKDERKNQEGSPQVKREVRKKMQQLTVSRMMAKVPDASVVITNPTRLAIAVKYDPDSNGAPIVVAKGKRLTAKRIREIARENGVPILERKPLARAMYDKVKVGSPVPSAFYEAVAELLAYLYRIGNARIRAQLSKH